jgi:enoyl-CoA hydratase/carnithine racemase
MTDQGEVRYEQTGSVVRLTFSRESARNAMTWKMYDELNAACDRIKDDPSVRVVVLRGEGNRAFIAGTDISQFADFKTGDDGLAYEARVEGIMGKLEALPQPTIAVVEGYAVGGGLITAVVCDLRICAPNARFGMPVARTLGNTLSMDNYARLAWMIGPGRTKELVLRADFVDAETALAIGLASEVVEPDQLDARVDELAEQLSNQAPLTMWATKESIRRLTIEGGKENHDIVHRVYGSADFKEGNAAFVEKRPANWQGI